uniref:Vacuolar protein sorting-associated protein 54 C-terminal domain-containing protein n=1 Tax=Timspurckia oligopyrenoides TaxID=708627 RepID=A0A7S0ZKA9_9RHOD
MELASTFQRTLSEQFKNAAPLGDKSQSKQNAQLMLIFKRIPMDVSRFILVTRTFYSRSNDSASDRNLLASIRKTLLNTIESIEKMCITALTQSFSSSQSLRALESLNIADLAHRLDVVTSVLSLNHKIEKEYSSLGLNRKFVSIPSSCRELCVNEIASLHRTQLGTLNAMLQKEKWVGVQVAFQIQALINTLRQLSRKKYTQKSQNLVEIHNDEEFISLDSDDDDNWQYSNDLEPTNAPVNVSTQQQLPSLSILSEKYVAVNSLLYFVEVLSKYAELEIMFSKSMNLSGEISRRALELTRAFNVSTSRQVLAANAIKSAGLKSITARHLCIAARVIAAVRALIKLYSHAVDAVLSNSAKSTLSNEFVKVENDLQIHESKLLDKLASVMLDRLDFHCTQLSQLPWSDESQMRKEDLPSNYMKNLLRETGVLHRVMYSTLPRSHLRQVFSSIEAAYGTKLSNAFDQVVNTFKAENHPWIQRRIEADVTFLYLKLHSMDALGNSEGSSSVDELRAKYTTSKRRLSSSFSAIERTVNPNVSAASEELNADEPNTSEKTIEQSNEPVQHHSEADQTAVNVSEDDVQPIATQPSDALQSTESDTSASATAIKTYS